MSTILARDVLDRGIICFTERQRRARIRNNSARDPDHDAVGVALDRDRMVRSRNLDRPCGGRNSHGGHPRLP